MVVKHGVSETSADKILIDAGAIYFNFYNAAYPGTLLGATRGGNVFELARTIRRIDADGAKGPVKGLRRVEEVVATIKANMLELTAENLRRAIAGAIYTSGYTEVGDEEVGTGNNIKTDFTLAHKPVQENTEAISVADRVPELQVRLTNYVIDYATGAVHFIEPPEDTKAITATYKYLPATTPVTGEALGDGDGVETVFGPLAHIPIEPLSDVVYIETVKQTRVTDYAINNTTGVITFVEPPGEGLAVTADYRYISGDPKITGVAAASALLPETAFIDNVVIVGTIAGSTNPVIVKITNALADAGFSLALAPKDEAVPEITFTAHYKEPDLDTEPWSIEYPAS